MTPAAPVHHLLVGQHGLALRAPVHPASFPVSDTALEHSQKKPLVPPVILRLASGNFPAPVVAEPEPLAHALERFNIRVRPFARMDSPLDRRVFRRQAKRVPSHRMHHVKPAHAFISSNYVTYCVIAHVTHVQRARRIWQHLQHIIFRLRGIGVRLERAVDVPPCLPPPLNRLWIVLRHGLSPLLPNLKMLNFQSLFAPALPLLRSYFLAFLFL